MKTQYMNPAELESPSLPFYVSRVVPRPSPPTPFITKKNIPVNHTTQISGS